MTKIPNKEQISRIIMKPTVCTKCQIGQDWYKSNLEIEFSPNECYPDYMEVQDWLMKNVDGFELNIEEVVAKVRDFIEEEYQPNWVSVKNTITGCKTHFDVEVIG